MSVLVDCVRGVLQRPDERGRRWSSEQDLPRGAGQNTSPRGVSAIRSRSASLFSLPANGENRSRPPPKKVCEKSTLILCPPFPVKFPVLAFRFPDLRGIFPVNLHRELSISPCGTAVFCSKTVARCLKIAKFPVSREFVWRRVRSALRRQPGSLAIGDFIRWQAERPAGGGFWSVQLLPAK
jgi:hypothetical protein